jgi:hypothetical protein
VNPLAPACAFTSTPLRVTFLLCNWFCFRSDAEDPDAAAVGVTSALGFDAESSASDESSDDDDNLDPAAISSQASVKDMNISAGSFLYCDDVFWRPDVQVSPDSSLSSIRVPRRPTATTAASIAMQSLH